MSEYITTFGDNSRPLLTFCFNTEAQIWEQDMWNSQIFNRVHDVLAQRTNQIFPIPEPTLDEPCLRKIQIAQDELNANCCNPGPPEGQGGQYAICGLDTKPISPTDNHAIKPLYNTHYRMTYPMPETQNLRNVSVESDLFFALNTPWNTDSMTISQVQDLETTRPHSNKLLYRKYHAPEAQKSCYPDQNATLFGNITKEIYNTIDDRNKFMLHDI